MHRVYRLLSHLLVTTYLLSACVQPRSATPNVIPTQTIAPVSTEAGRGFTATDQPALKTEIPTMESTTESPAPDLEPTPSPDWIGPEVYPPGVNPLTGLAVSDPALLERRPVMIKVSNYPAYLRPHSGLSYADLVWEYYIGVGMTRFLALFYSQDAPQVGPVRSGRLIDPQLVLMYGGILGLVSADSYVWQVIKDAIPGRYVTEKPLTCPALCRQSAEHSVFADTSALSEYVNVNGLDNQRPELSGMEFHPQPPAGGQWLDSLWIYISYYDQVKWEFDEGSGAYLRSQEVAQEDGTVSLAPMPDRLTGEQLAFENVVILFTHHDEIKPELIDMDLINAQGKRALVLRDGMLYEAKYYAESRDAPLRFYDSQGNPLPFKPGTTWFMIMGDGSTLEELDAGSWKMRFYP